MAINTPFTDSVAAADKRDNVVGETSPATSRESTTSQLALTLLPFAIALVGFTYLAWPTLSWWWWEYTRFESYYSHGPLIPVMAGFMLWHNRVVLSQIEKRMSVVALALLIPALALLVFSEKIDARALESVGVIASIWGAVWFAFGTKFFKAAWFPLLFLSLMMPLPGPLLNDATLSLQMVSTHFAAKILNAITFTNTQQGNIITMSNFKFFVDVPCSGFKTLLALFTFNAFLAAMLDGPVWKRVCLFLMCAPLAIVINSVRIALIGIVGECLGDDSAHVFHDYSGLLTLTLGFIFLFSIARSLGCKKFAGLDIF